MTNKLGPTWWKERFNSCKLPSDVHLSVPSPHILTHIINIKNKEVTQIIYTTIVKTATTLRNLHLGIAVLFLSIYFY